MSLITDIGGLTYAVAAGVAVGTVSKMIPPEIQRNSYRFMAISLASVILSRSFEKLITQVMGEEDKDASMEKRLTHTYIKMFVPAVPTTALVYLFARSGRIAEEPLTVATVSLTTTCVHFISRQLLTQLFREEPKEMDYKEAEAPAAAPAWPVPVQPTAYFTAAQIAALAAQAAVAPAAAAWPAPAPAAAAWPAPVQPTAYAAAAPVAALAASQAAEAPAAEVPVGAATPADSKDG